MKRPRSVRNLCRAIFGAGVLAVTHAAMAQAPARLVERDQAWLDWVVLVAIILVTCITGFIKAKRSHLN